MPRLGAGAQQRRQGGDRPVVGHGRLAHGAVRLGDRAGQQREQLDGRHGG
ncbi:hypothetical protein [Micromonospora sp. NBC_01412]